MKKLLALALVLASVIVLFTACPAQNASQPQTEPNSKTEGTSTKPALDTSEFDEWGRPIVESALPADLQFNNDQVNIFVENGSMSEFTAEKYTDDIINDSIYDRNLKVETDLKVKLNFIESANGSTGFVSDVEKIVSAGTNDYDVAIGYSYFMVSGVRSMNYANLYEVPNLDLSKPWWNQRYVNEATLADQIYTVTGDLSLSSTYMPGLPKRSRCT